MNTEPISREQFDTALWVLKMYHNEKIGGAYRSPSRKESIENPVGYSKSHKVLVSAFSYKNFEVANKIVKSADDIICPVCWEHGGKEVPFDFSTRQKGSLHEGGTPYFSHHVNADFEQFHTHESEWHVAAKALLQDHLLSFDAVASVKAEVWDKASKRRADVETIDIEGAKVAFEVQKSAQSRENYLMRSKSYSRSSIGNQWLYHASCPTIYPEKPYYSALVLDFPDLKNPSKEARIGIIVTEKTEGSDTYFVLADNGNNSLYHAMYTPLNDWKYTAQGLRPKRGSAAHRLVKNLRIATDFHHTTSQIFTIGKSSPKPKFTVVSKRIEKPQQEKRQYEHKPIDILRMGVFSQADALTIPRIQWFMTNYFCFEDADQQELFFKLAENFDLTTLKTAISSDEHDADLIDNIFWQKELDTNASYELLQVKMDKRWYEIMLNFCRIHSVEGSGFGPDILSLNVHQPFLMSENNQLSIEEMLDISREEVYAANHERRYELPRFTGPWPGTEVWYESNKSQQIKDK